MRPRVMVVFDSIRDLITVVSPVRPTAGTTARAAYEEALSASRPGRRCPGRSLADRGAGGPVGGRPSRAVSNTSPDAFAAMVARAKEYIVAGDVSRWCCPSASRRRSPAGLQPVPLPPAHESGAVPVLSRFRDVPDRLLVAGDPRPGARGDRHGSPDRRKPAAAAQTRPRMPRSPRNSLPIRRRGAEHLMLLDLGRNDAGRVSRIGSVRVTDSFFIERYSQVMHIVSNVEGDLDPRHDPLDALAAGFPPGRSRGRRRCGPWEIIDELEREKRGPYAGCIGYFGARGDDGHLHRPAHRGGEGWSDARPGRGRDRVRFRILPPSSRNASTRPRRCSAPPRRRCGSPRRRNGGSRRGRKPVPRPIRLPNDGEVDRAMRAVTSPACPSVPPRCPTSSSSTTTIPSPGISCT